jgi:hypothetical protein
MPVGIDHFPISHLNLHLFTSNSEIPLAKAQRRKVTGLARHPKPMRGI